MTPTSSSRRGALALAAALTAIVLTAIAAVGGIQNWNRQAHAPQPAITQPAQFVPSVSSGEEND